MQAADSMELIADQVRTCTRCSLSRSRTIAVPGEGPNDAEIFFIGEGPGYNEDLQGRPFVGAAGQLLVEMLATIGKKRSDVFITNVVRCRPPNNRDPQSDELAACDTYSMRQVACLRPLLIVTLGRYSMARFFGPGTSITRLHGSTTTWEGITCLAMYHPAYILRAQTPALRRAYEDDFQKISVLVKAARSETGVKGGPRKSSEEPLDQLKLL